MSKPKFACGDNNCLIGEYITNDKYFITVGVKFGKWSPFQVRESMNVIKPLNKKAKDIVRVMQYNLEVKQASCRHILSKIFNFKTKNEIIYCLNCAKRLNV